VISLLISAGVAFFVTLFLTPVLIRSLRERNIGQFIQEELEGHSHKRGTPTMGGLVMLMAVLVGYVVAHLRFFTIGGGFDPSVRPFSPQGWLAMFAFLGMGLIGFVDDYTKYARKQNQGLSKRWKFLGQLAIAGLFAYGAIQSGVSTRLAVTGGGGIELAPIVYAGLVLVMLVAAANAVNLTDGLDGLVAGSGALVFGAYVLIGFWEFRNLAFYEIKGALDLAVFAAALMGSTLGFLWWNTAPARIIMGDVGSQALGGALAALALLTKTELLLIVLGGLYVMVTASVIAQVISYRVFGRRIFKMAPIHHHFELIGWSEPKVITRFLIVAVIFALFSLTTLKLR